MKTPNPTTSSYKEYFLYDRFGFLGGPYPLLKTAREVKKRNAITDPFIKKILTTIVETIVK